VSAVTEPSTMCSSTGWPCGGRQTDRRPWGFGGERELPAVVEQHVPLAIGTHSAPSRSVFAHPSGYALAPPDILLQ